MEEYQAVVDWSMAIRAAGYKRELAEDLFGYFINQLPNDSERIELAYQKKDYAALLKNVHKLHGALCYLGVPRLKEVVARLEENLKNHIIDRLPNLMMRFHEEVSLLLNYVN